MNYAALSTATAVAAMSFVLPGSSATAADADGDAKPCATGAEYKAIRAGMKLKKVRNIIDSKGSSSFFGVAGPNYVETWVFTACGKKWDEVHVYIAWPTDGEKSEHQVTGKDRWE